jgi:hypothetical protein
LLDEAAETRGGTVEAPGVATSQGQFRKLARTRALLVKLLTGGTFDVFIASSPLFEGSLESTQCVEALWRRREPVPDSRRRPGVSAPIIHQPQRGAGLLSCRTFIISVCIRVFLAEQGAFLDFYAIIKFRKVWTLSGFADAYVVRR